LCVSMHMFLIDRRYLRDFDWVSLFLVLLLSTIGILFVFSATYKPSVPYSLLFKKQLFGVVTGFFLYIGCCFIDYRTLLRWGYVCYIVTIILLFFTIIIGSITVGVQRWISVGLFKFQPSELAKLLFPAFFTHYLSTRSISSLSFVSFIPILFVLTITALLVLKQPHLGNTLIILFSGTVLLWMAGIGKQFFIGLFFIGLMGAPLAWNWLHPYQKKRIAVFLGEGDPRKERYQIEQSQIAIGSGASYGKGFLQGTQNKLRFLPETHTDFIFSVMCEEWGFVGSCIILMLYLWLFLRLLTITTTIGNHCIRLLSVGLILPTIFSTIINIGMVVGLLPIVGIPLPFMSYGISHMWVTFIGLGWLNGIACRRFYINRQNWRSS
jgi:rod shape determining protein RodA